MENLANIDPIIWLAVRQQVYIVAGQSLFAALLFFGVSWWFRNLARSAWHEWKGNSDGTPEAMWLVVSFGLFMTAIVTGLVALASSVSRFLNPDYYTIKLLLKLL